MMKSWFYWLLVALFVMLTIVGIIEGWKNYYLLSLLGITFGLLLGKHLSFILDRIKLYVSSCKLKIVKSYHDMVIKVADSLYRKINRWENCDISNPPLLLLSPEIDNKAHKEYVGRLKVAIDNPDVHNVALMGSYGSGKSSILKTFKANNPSLKYVDVSLASFGNQEVDKDDVDKLLYSILQQLFYHVKLSDIPESRFGRIVRIGLVSRIVLTVLLFLLIVSYVCLFQAEWFTKNVVFAEPIVNDDWVKVAAFIILVFGMCLLLYILVRFIKRLGIKNVGIDMTPAKIEIENRKNKSVLNNYLDEIIYFFQKKKYEVVFFEDLDRFGKNEIFTKLRELNTILNQSEDINRRIVFVYALCDEVFSCPEDKTKFFDYIIPVIPYVNVSNSGDLLMRSFKDLEISLNHLTTDFLTDISHFVNDTRVVKNIVNEFTLYHNVLDSKLNMQHLLAIILYKNLYSEDFGLLHQGKGMLYDVFASVPKLKDRKRKGIRQRMMDIASEIKLIDDEVLRNISELKSVVIANFLRYKNDDTWHAADDVGYPVKIEQLFDDKYIRLILQGSMGFKDRNAARCGYVGKKEITAVLGSDFDYNKRKELIEKKGNGELEKLRKERKSLELDLTVIDELPLQKLVKNTSEVFSCVSSYQNLSEVEMKNYNVLGYLLKEGYIDEDYFYYISIFQEGRLTPQDNEFLLSVKFDEPKRYDYQLVEVETLLDNLNPKDFDKPAIINFDLLEFMLEHENMYHDKSEALIETLSIGRNLDLVYAYINGIKWGNKPIFINKLAKYYVNIWNDVCEESILSLQDKMDLLKMLFAHAEIDAIKNINEHCSFSDFLNQGNNWQDAFESCDGDKALNVLDVINVKIEELKEGISDSARLLLKHICESGMYELSLHNLKFVAVGCGLGLTNPNSSVYSVIMNSNQEKIKKQILDNIGKFAECVAKEQDDNFVTEDEIIELLKNKNVDSKTKIDLITNKQFKVSDISEIDEDLLCYLLGSDKMQANINNVMDYYGVNDDKFNEELINHMNKHVVELCDDIKGKTKIEEGENDFLPAIIKESRLDRQLSYAIMDNISLWEAWNEHVPDLNDAQLLYALRKKILPLDYMNVQAANNFLEHFTKDDSKFDYGLFVKALEISDNKALKAFTVAICIERGLLHVNEIPSCLTAMGNPFDRLKQVGEYVKVPVLNGMNEFLDALHTVRYVGNIKKIGDDFSVRVRKTR